MDEAAARLERARTLEARGLDDAAKSAYLEYLQQTPDDADALIAFGNLALRTGYRSAACTAYRRVIALYPANPVARVNLGNALLQGDDPAAARRAYEAALAIDASFAPAHQGLSYAYARLGEERAASQHRDLGFRGHAFMHVPFRGPGEAVEVVAIVSAAGGDFNTALLLDSARFDVTKVFAEYADALPAGPATAAVVNAIGDADRCAEALTAAQRLTAGVMQRVINRPDRVLQTGRAAVAEKLRKIDGIVTPRMALSTRDEIERTAWNYPLLLRTPGHHTGRHFVRVENARELSGALEALPGDELLAIEFIDVRGADGLFRKYRVLAVDGELFPAHAAAAESWKVHFFTSEAERSASARAEDAAFLADPQSVLPRGAWSTLHTVVRAFGLEYMGIDFAIDRASRIVVFEANAAMSVYPAAPGPLWDYRRPAIERVAGAFREMIRSSKSRSSASKIRGT